MKKAEIVDMIDIEDKLTNLLIKSNARLKCKKLKKLIQHSQHVEKIALKIYSEVFKDDRYRNIIIAGALLHDIKKYRNDGQSNNKHNKTGKKFLKYKMLKKYFKKSDVMIIKKIIRYHRGKMKYIDNYDKDIIKVIEIVRAADKISKVYKKHYDDPILNFSREIIICEKLQKLKSKKVKKVAKNLLEELA